MLSTQSEEVELSKKHEEILGKRAVLLLQMESLYKQQKCTRKQQVKMSHVAHERNAQLLQDLQKIENRLGTKQLPHPDILTLETRYWASVEENIPEWERFLLGGGSTMDLENKGQTLLQPEVIHFTICYSSMI
uniref:Uncharacterized protein n=1 Tax=Esox lucius TaxID=8010 RepID=A0A3P8XT74_ESOLU